MMVDQRRSEGRGWGTSLAAVALLLVAGCGWHVRGSTPLPATLTRTYLDSADTHSEFDRALRRTLETSGAQLVTAPGDATTILRIRRDDSGRRVLSVSARNTPEEYQVFYAVEYSVEVSGREVIPRQSLERVNDYSYDEAAVLAKEREESELRTALARELAGLVVRRLASL